MRLRYIGDSKFVCSDCVPYKPTASEGHHFIETEYIPKMGYVWKSRIKELHRRVILPHTDGNSHYYVGRRGENGRIQEREPDSRY